MASSVNTVLNLPVLVIQMLQMLRLASASRLLVMLPLAHHHQTAMSFEGLAHHSHHPKGPVELALHSSRRPIVRDSHPHHISPLEIARILRGLALLPDPLQCYLPRHVTKSCVCWDYLRVHCLLSRHCVQHFEKLPCAGIQIGLKTMGMEKCLPMSNFVRRE